MRTFLFFLLPLFIAPAFADQDRTIVEALLRMENFDLGSSEKAQGAVNRFLEKHLATDEGIRLVEKYKLPVNDALLDLALKKPTDPIGTRAARLLAKRGQTPKLSAALTDAKTAQAAIVVLKSLGDNKTLSAVLPDLIQDKDVDPSVRIEGQKALADIDAKQLLALADKLPERKQALDLLLTHRDEKIRVAAQKLAGASAKLAAYEQLAKRRGDVGKGKAVYQRSCAVCHMPSPLNIDFGPNLSEIGSKLPREALYQAIVEPNAGISMGFEAVQVDVKASGAAFIGFLSSTTDKDITLRMPGGLVQVYAKKDVVTKKLKASLMPEGLAQTMSEAELVDLVEYLAALKTK